MRGIWHLSRSLTKGAAWLRPGTSPLCSTDVRHLCRQSGVGARIFESALPITPALATFLAATGAHPLRCLTQSGEDYALLFTVSPGGSHELIDDFHATCDTPIARIGTVTSDREAGVVLRDGSIQNLTGGHDHFST